MKNLNEDSRSDLIRRSKKADHYKDTSKGKTRYDRRVFSKLANSVKDYNKVDMNKLFKENILDLDIAVEGETDDYVVRVSWGGFLTSLQGYLEKMQSEDINFRAVSRALSDSFNHNDVYVHCSCPDATYRQNYWQTMNNISSGDPENRPSDITNPNDTKGAGCKHVMLVLSNLSYWQIKMSSVIFNYINYMKEHYERLYADVIYPAIFEKEYEEPVQLDIDTSSEEDNKLETDSDIIDTSNKWAKTKNQFKVGNEFRFKKDDKEIEGQKQFDLDSLMSD